MGDVENSAGQTQATGLNSAYIASPPGILKIVEAVSHEKQRHLI
jgi:hypothetical protein